jgi:hypothetical protein
MPGRHLVGAIALWEVAGVPVATSAERHVWVGHPVTSEDNEVAALLLHPEVGAAVAAGDLSGFEQAEERIKKVPAKAAEHPALTALADIGLLPKPRAKRSSRAKPRKART